MALYEFYKEDFLMFGYSPQEFLTWLFLETFTPRLSNTCQSKSTYLQTEDSLNIVDHTWYLYLFRLKNLLGVDVLHR